MNTRELESGVDYRSLDVVIGDYRLCTGRHRPDFFAGSDGTIYELADLVPEPAALAEMFIDPLPRRTFREMLRDYGSDLIRRAGKDGGQ